MKAPRRLAAILLLSVALPLPAFAKKYTPSTFRTELSAALEGKTGPRAYNQAAKFLQKALADTKNKKYAFQFAKSVKNALKGNIIKIPNRGRAANTLTKGLIAGYFAKKNFDLYDRDFNRSLKIILSTLPLSQKTQTVSQSIYNTIKTYASRYGVSQLDVFTYYQTIDSANRLPEPVS